MRDVVARALGWGVRDGQCQDIENSLQVHVGQHAEKSMLLSETVVEHVLLKSRQMMEAGMAEQTDGMLRRLEEEIGRRCKMEESVEALQVGWGMGRMGWGGDRIRWRERAC